MTDHSAGADRPAGAPSVPWNRRALARATGVGGLAVLAVGIVAASPPGTYVPVALFALFFLLLLLPLWLYALASALRHGPRGLLGRLAPLSSLPALVLLGVWMLRSPAVDRAVARAFRGSLKDFEVRLQDLSPDRARPELDWLGPYAVRTVRVYGADRAAARIELSGTRLMDRGGALVYARDEAALEQMRRLDPSLELWPLIEGWYGGTGEALESRR